MPICIARHHERPMPDIALDFPGREPFIEEQGHQKRSTQPQQTELVSVFYHSF